MSFDTHVYEFVLGLYPGVELLHYRIFICLVLKDIVKHFSKVMLPISTSTNNT